MTEFAFPRPIARRLLATFRPVSFTRLRNASRLAACFLGLGCLAHAQQVAVRKPPTAAALESRKAMQNAAKNALTAGDAKAALEHLLASLWIDPFAADVFELALTSPTLDPDTKALLAMDYLAARVDAKGNVAVPKPVTEALTKLLPTLTRLENMRIQAASEAAAVAKKYGRSNKEIGSPVVARCALELFLDLTRGAPGAWDSSRSVLEDAVAPRTENYAPIVNGLSRLAHDALANKNIALAIRAARTLYGLCVQSKLPDLKGPKPPDLSKKREDAEDVLAQARALLAKQTQPMTLEELDQLTEDDAIHFTLDHADPGNPGVSISPTGLYRIETICGHQTLSVATRTVELHHQRLVNWYGQDPFQGRRGLIRIVPEASDLESEGAPYWWAGGFQSGDTTVVRLSASDSVSLGGGLTHELTHRFDGAIYPGMPGWLAEGRAVWTADSYGRFDSDFEPRKAEFGTIENAMRKGYGGEEKLKKLIEGTIEDYRDNYVAGYALFVYLNTWEEPEGKPIFSPRLVEYMKALGSSKKKPLELFTSHFCDGRDGRPKEFKDFATGFGNFLNGFYWLNPDLTIRNRYKSAVTPVQLAQTIWDGPTWAFSRNRAEPWFGQEQAALAGELLAANGLFAEAAASFAFGYQVDEFRTDRALRFAELLEKQREPNAAWALRTQAWRREPVRAPRPPGSPWVGQLGRSKAFVEQLVAASAELRAAALPRAAARLEADAIRIASYLGIEVKPAVIPAVKDLAEPFTAIPRDIGTLGYEESELTGYEEYRVPNLWYTTDDQDLHVGRERPRDLTGALDRSAALHHGYARSREWLTPGRYRIKGSIYFTTSYVSGAVILGHTRRDRNVRLSFSAGDYMFSIGQKEDANKIKSVSVSLAAIRDGESPSNGRAIDSSITFDIPKEGFEFEVLVDGGLAIATIDGRFVGAYATADGQPIEGYVGFAVGNGAYRVSRPTIEIENRIADLNADDGMTTGLRLDATGPVTSAEILYRRARGLPLDPNGNVIVWMSDVENDAPIEIDKPQPPITKEQIEKEAYRAATMTRRVSEMLWRDGFDPPIVLVVPQLIDETLRAKIAKLLAEDPVVRATVVSHAKAAALVVTERTELPPGMDALLFQDGTGVIRSMDPLMHTMDSVPNTLASWLRFQRNKQRPVEIKPAGG